MNLFAVKALCAAVLWLISVVFGVVLPYFLWKISPKRDSFTRLTPDSEGSDNQELNDGDELAVYHQQGNSCQCSRLLQLVKSKICSKNASSLVYCLCGGVFLGVSLLDLMPESRAAVTQVIEASPISTSYPIAEFMIAFGLLLVMIIEKVVSACMNHTTQSESQTAEDGDEHGFYDQNRNVSAYRMYILVSTLSLHSIFEGLAIGLQNQVTTIIQLAVAISVHKAVLTFGVGMPLFETLGKYNKMKSAIICAMIFCSASPVGCFVGAFVSSGQHANSLSGNIARAILQCFATGTFLYVTFLEVIPKEFSHHAHSHQGHSRRSTMNNVLHGDSHQVHVHHNHENRSFQLLKVLALLIGFSIASGLQFLSA